MGGGEGSCRGRTTNAPRPTSRRDLVREAQISPSSPSYPSKRTLALLGDSARSLPKAEFKKILDFARSKLV